MGLLLGVVVTAGSLVTQSQTVIVVAPMIAAIGYRQLVRYRSEQARRAMRSSLVEEVDRLILNLRSGLSLIQACAVLAERGRGDDPPQAHSPLLPLAEAIRSRRTLGEAASALAFSPHGRNDPSVQLISMTIEVLAANGGPALPALQRLRHTLMGFVHSQQQADSEASQALASAAMMAVAPAVFAGAMVALDSRLGDFYLHESLGTGCVLGALVLAYSGWHWMEKIILSRNRTSW